MPIFEGSGGGGEGINTGEGEDGLVAGGEEGSEQLRVYRKLDCRAEKLSASRTNYANQTVYREKLCGASDICAKTSYLMFIL